MDRYIESECGNYLMNERKLQHFMKNFDEHINIMTFFALSEERKRQNEKHPQTLEPFQRLATIVEEIGEVSEALQENNLIHAHTELIQTAATCIRMAEEIIEFKKEIEK